LLLTGVLVKLQLNQNFFVMETQNTKPPGRRAKNLLTGLLVVAAMLLIAILVAVSLQIRNSRMGDQNAALEAEKTALTAEQLRLQEEKSERDQRILNLQGEIQSLTETHEEAMQDWNRQIARLGRRAAEVEVLQKKLEEYEGLQDEYDKLRNQYRQLVREWGDLDSKHEKAMVQFKALQDSVNRSRDLSAHNIFALTKWERWLWADRYHVDQARRIDETIVSFEINGNPFAPPGTRRIHLNMIDPAGRIMYASGQSFQLAGNGEEIPFTKTREINYDRQAMRLQFSVAHPERLEPGIYRLRVYIDGKLSGEKEIRLE
jgi:hypothetical protein